MAAKKNPKDDWLDPNAPSAALGELAAVIGDYEQFMRESVGDLHDLGVSVVWSREPDMDLSTCAFRSKDPRLASVAREAYRLGMSQSKHSHFKKEFERVWKALKGNRISQRKKALNKDKRQKQFLLMYAEEIMKGKPSLSLIAKACNISRQSAYRYRDEFDDLVRKERDRLRRRGPLLTAIEIEAAIVADHAGELGVNAATVHAALKTRCRK
jgi:hypothetical protein